MTDLDEEMEIDEAVMNYDFAMKEVILSELNCGKLSFDTSPTHIYCKCCSDPNSVYQQMKQSMEQQYFQEKQGEYLYRWSLIVSCVCLCLCVYVCVFVSVCVYVYVVCICVCACVCMRVYVHMCI